MKCKVLSIVLIVALFSCSPARFIKPLEKNQKAVMAHLGGPLINFSGIPMPIPFSSIGFGYGLRDRLTVYSAWHTTSALFGNWQQEFGISFEPLSYRFPIKCSIQTGVQGIQGFRMIRVLQAYPTLDLNIYRELPKKSGIMYLSQRSWFNFYALKAHGESRSNVIVSGWHLGFQKNTPKYKHLIEWGWIMPQSPNQPNVVKFIGLKGQGALSIQYSITHCF